MQIKEKMAQITLYIIGNGFDIAHGIDSRYSDFERYVRQQGKKNLVTLMDVFFSNKRDLWGDIEKALGEYDENSVLDFCRPDEEFDIDHSLRDSAIIEDSPDAIFKPTLADFYEIFDDWVEGIDISKARQIFSFSKSDLFFTFNYTDTLETIYQIPQSQVLHIHGSRILKGDKYILGHNNYRDPLEAFDDESEMLFEQNAYEKIITWMNGYVKNTHSIIAGHKSFFSKLTNIGKIVTIGHSFYEVDWPYMEEIVKVTGQNTEWEFHYHSFNNDLPRMKSFVSQVGLNKVKYVKP